MAANDSLGKKLAFLSSGSFEDSLNDDPIPSLEIQMEAKSSLKSKDSDDEEIITKKKKKKDKFQSLMEESNRFIEDNSSGLVDEFDNYLDSKFVDDEDSDLKNSLIGLGRKYARENKSTPESSEVSKAFSKNEKALDDLYSEIQKDKTDLQKDITSMRAMRTRNFKALSDLVTTKSALHGTALSTIKEMDSIKKAQFDIKLKSKKPEDIGNGSGDASKAIQSIFGIGRENLLGSVGGYESASGAINDGDEIPVGSSLEDSDEVIQAKYFKDENDHESDGDKFLKYEGLGVQYILLIDENDNKQIIAEDSEGNIVPDYPMPTDPDQLNFEISESTATAEDDLHRKYKVRHI